MTVGKAALLHVLHLNGQADSVRGEGRAGQGMHAADVAPAIVASAAAMRINCIPETR